MLICKLKNGAIVSLEDVKKFKTHIDSLLNDLYESKEPGFSKRAPVDELINKANSEQYAVTNIKIKDILAHHGFLDDKGSMPEIVRNIIQSSFEYEHITLVIKDPVLEVLGDLVDASL